MDRLNQSVSGIDRKLQSGNEPVSGESGQGTAEQPFDQGNAEGTPLTAPSMIVTVVASSPIERKSIECLPCVTMLPDSLSPFDAYSPTSI